MILKSPMRRVQLPFRFVTIQSSARTSYSSGTRTTSNPGRPLTRPVSTRSDSSRIIFSGIQPTGIPHLGNYFGALVNWVKLQDAAAPHDKLLFSVVGWHALTLPQDPKALFEARTTMIALLLASGIDHRRSIVFHQDEVQNHTELAWILSCITPIGKLKRMTTWKSRLAVSRNANDESEVDDSLLNAGLFTYPILQAADILAYRATHVPVGEDQQQHLELTRDLAETFNRTYPSPTPLFKLPELMLTPSKRILSLRDSTVKMSKSAADPNSRILLTDSYETIAKRVRSAVTDSISGITFDPVERPGTSNLLMILSACTGETPAALAERYANSNHGALKKDVVEAVEEALRKPRAEFSRLCGEKAFLEQVARDGAQKAQEQSNETLKEVRMRVGLDYQP
ncbi:tryptophanyl-tRNA synthetase [Multifurca ochricompacta]|uniref:Tryptophan--tRNA ligase, mitochondrial n=1 Tax=Multifurca ochricompacta TaxID=376703 RepID=A0AAD4QPL7_9AGAM|nr:tryptophanyl-tRNA synthetase [Multifurca ochricompacta]